MAESSTPRRVGSNGNQHLDAQVIRLDEHVRALATQYGELKGEVGKVRAETEAAFKGLAADLAQRFDRMETRFGAFKDEAAARSRPNWVALGSLGVGGFTVMCSLMGAAFFLMTLNTRSEIAPVLSAIEVGTQDRADLRRDFDLLVEDIRSRLLTLREDLTANGAADGAARAALSSDLREVETQFCAADSIRELERAQLRDEIASVRREAGLPIGGGNGFTPQVGRCQ